MTKWSDIKMSEEELKEAVKTLLGVTASLRLDNFTRDGVVYSLRKDKIVAKYLDEAEELGGSTDIVIPKFVDIIAEDGFRKSPITSVTIENPSIEIGEGAFESCLSLKTVNLPEGLKKIGPKTFAGTKELRAVTIPSTVEEISDTAFDKSVKLFKVKNTKSATARNATNNLKSLIANSATPGQYIKDGVAYVAEGSSGVTASALDTKHTLSIPKDVEILEGTTAIGCFAFAEQSDLQSVKLPSTLKVIQAGAFSGCESLKEIVLPNGLLAIQDNAFALTSLSSVTMPPTLIHIGREAFVECQDLTDVVLNEGLECIEEYAFNSTGVKSVVIPSTIKGIHRTSFNRRVQLIKSQDAHF